MLTDRYSLRVLGNGAAPLTITGIKPSSHPAVVILAKQGSVGSVTLAVAISPNPIGAGAAAPVEDARISWRAYNPVTGAALSKGTAATDVDGKFSVTFTTEAVIEFLVPVQYMIGSESYDLALTATAGTPTCVVLAADVRSGG